MLLEARLAAVVCMIKHDAVHPHVPAGAIAMFEEQWNTQHPPGSLGHINAVRQFLSYNFQKLHNSYTLQTGHSGGHAPRIPDEVAKRCANILAEGYMQQRYLFVEDHVLTYTEHAYFTSIKDAVQHEQYLQGVLQQYDVSLDHLLRRCKEVDPQLVYRRLPMKRALPERTVQLRRTFGLDQQMRLLQIPSLLYDTFFMDECTIWVGKDLMNRLRVWCHRGEFEGQPPFPNRWLGRGQPFKISFLLVVSARKGWFYKEFLTGTQHLPELGRHNAEMQATIAQRQGEPYKVRLVT